MELSITTIVIYGEHLRDILWKANPPLIRNRWKLFHRCKNSFVGSEVIDWLIKDSEIKSFDYSTTYAEIESGNNSIVGVTESAAAHSQTLQSDDALKVMQVLLDFQMIRDINRDAIYKNDASLYCFASDDESYNKVIEALVKGRRLYDTTACCDCDMMRQVFEGGELVSDRCMGGSDLVTWLVEHGLASHQEDSNRICQLLLTNEIIKPASLLPWPRQKTRNLPTERLVVPDKKTGKASGNNDALFDDRTFYMFNLDYSEPPISTETFASLTRTEKFQEIVRVGKTLLDLLINDTRSICEKQDEISRSSFHPGDSVYVSALNSLPVSPPPEPSYESLLQKDGKLTPKALVHPDAPFIRKEIQLFPDAVGYGFVIRGSSPCYIKIVDPASPAGKAGLKAWQFIVEINECKVTQKGHVQVADMILSGPRFLSITVMAPKDEDGYAHVRGLYTVVKEFSLADIHFGKSHGSSALQRIDNMPVSVSPRPCLLPSAQSWMTPRKRKAPEFWNAVQKPTGEIRSRQHLSDG